VRPSETLEAELQLFPIQPAQQHRIKQTGESRFPGTEEYRGKSSAYGVNIHFAWNAPEEEASDEEAESAEPSENGESVEIDEAEPEFTLEILDTEGNRLRRLKPSPKSGLNRITWNLRRDGFRWPGQAKSWDVKPSGPEVPPGTYEVVLTYGDKEARGTFEVQADPNATGTAAGSAARWAAMQRIGAVQEKVAEVVEAIDATLADLKIVAAKLKENRDPKADNPDQAIVDQCEEFEEALNGVRETFMGKQNQKGIVRSVDSVNALIGTASWGLGSSWEAPSATHMRRLVEVEEALEEALPEYTRVMGEELDTLRAAIDGAGVRLLPLR
jgi:hypothetical protein